MTQAAIAAPTFPRVGKYVIGRRIGAGGMAIVDAAFLPGPAGGRLVALKRIASTLSGDPSARRLFLREASIMTRLEHPNVVRTYEIGEIEGETFIAMELLAGASLADLQRATTQKIPLPIALRIVRDALRGLHAAHELCGADGVPLGLVHQDISPQNVHVAYEGTTRILDFGVARMAAVDASRTDSVRGKACYLAPEQLKLRSVDRRADVFAFGIVFHELLTGTPLFPRAQADVAYAAILSGEFPTPRMICAEVPEEIDAVVRRALAMDPSERFPSADEMRRAIVVAQERVGIGEVDVADVGAWVEQVAPPSWTRAELERALGEAPGVVTAMAATADLPTIRPRRAPARSTKAASRWRLISFAVVVAGCGVVLEVARLSSWPRSQETHGIVREEPAVLVPTPPTLIATPAALVPAEIAAPPASASATGEQARTEAARFRPPSHESPRRRTSLHESPKTAATSAASLTPALSPDAIDPLATQ